jgi:hypothetical protein
LTPLPEVSIELRRWREVLGPSLLVAAYYELENARRFEEWRELVRPQATITQAFDGRSTATMNLIDRIEASVRSMADLHAEVLWIRHLSSRAAVAESHVSGTLADGGAFNCDAIGKYELDEEGRIERITVYHLHPGEVARGAAQ